MTMTEENKKENLENKKEKIIARVIVVKDYK